MLTFNNYQSSFEIFTSKKFPYPFQGIFQIFILIFQIQLILFILFIITKSKIGENTILKQLDVYVLLHLQHFPTNSQIDQILYIKKTYILCNNIQ